MVHVSRIAEMETLLMTNLVLVLNVMTFVHFVTEQISVSAPHVLMDITKKMVRIDVISVIMSVQHVQEVPIRNVLTVKPVSSCNQKQLAFHHAQIHNMERLTLGLVKIVMLHVPCATKKPLWTAQLV